MGMDYYIACDDCEESQYVHKWPGWCIDARPISQDLTHWIYAVYLFLTKHKGHRISLFDFGEYPHGEGVYTELPEPTRWEEDAKP